MSGRNIETIKSDMKRTPIEREITKQEISKKRKEYKNKNIPITISSVKINNPNKKLNSLSKSILKEKKSEIYHL